MKEEMVFLKSANQTTGSYHYNSICLSAKYSESKYNIFFNFILAHKDIEDRIFYTNNLIKGFWTQWHHITETLHMEPSPINSGKFINAEYSLIFHFYTGRDIVQNLKRIADECIILYCIALQKFKKDNTPLEDIGDYINKSDSFKDLDADIEFLKNLNKLSNACKHSLIPINDKIGKDEPCIYAYETKRDKTGEFLYLLNDFGFSLNYLVKAFNVFYTNFLKLLRQ